MSNKVVEHTFRHEFGRIVAKLSAKYGTTNLMEIEDAVSDALISALKTWGYDKIPENPAAWLFKVADNKLLDKLRRKQKYENDILPKLSFDKAESVEQDELELIRLMLWCAHPSLEYRDQIAIILKLVSGFSNKEIAAALLLNVETIKKRIQRAKKKIKSLESTVELPFIKNVPERFSSLRKALYLTFNEGYFSLNTSNTVREDLIYEALRLCKILTDIDHENRMASYALLALMTFHTSRLESRVTGEDSIVLLEDQDRSLWNRDLIKIANLYLGKSMNKKQMTEYHIEACIAAVHTNSKHYNDTDWEYISELYKSLCKAIPNPITKLNYAFSLLKAGNNSDCIAILEKINVSELNQHRYLYHATLSTYYKEINNLSLSKKSLWDAIDSCQHDEVRKVLTKRLENY